MLEVRLHAPMLPHIEWQSIFIGAIGGGSLVKVAELGIAWAKEKREQGSGKTSHEKDRPRFRVDVSIFRIVPLLPLS